MSIVRYLLRVSTTIEISQSNPSAGKKNCGQPMLRKAISETIPRSIKPNAMNWRGNEMCEPSFKPHNVRDHRAGTAGTSDHPFQKHAQVRLRVHRIVIHSCLPLLKGSHCDRNTTPFESGKFWNLVSPSLVCFPWDQDVVTVVQHEILHVAFSLVRSHSKNALLPK